MKVSIIVPIYKVENEIIRCISSVVHQTYRNIELILVNDSTPDRSYDLAVEYLKEINFPIKVVHIEHRYNKGLSEARNSAIQKASGEYLFFLDSDDALVSKNIIESLVNLTIAKNFPEVVMGSFKKIYLNGDENVYPLKTNFYKYNSEIFAAYINAELWMTACGKLVSRKFILDNNLFFEPGIYHEDELWSFLLFRRLNTLYVTSIPTYKYYEREGSITSQLKIKNVVDLITVLEKMYASYLSRSNYQAKETLLLIGRLRRQNFRQLMKFSDHSILLREIVRLKKIKIPLFSRSTSLTRFNFFILLPPHIILFLAKKRS